MKNTTSKRVEDIVTADKRGRGICNAISYVHGIVSQKKRTASVEDVDIRRRTGWPW